MPAEKTAENLVTRLGKFRVGDLVDGNPTIMPGVGKIIVIVPGRERPYICEHNDTLYQFKATEIEHHDFY